MNYKVSIVMPIFKHSVLVKEAIISALNQKTDFDYNIILVNDGCPHSETDEVCKYFANKFPKKVFYVKKENGGLSSARNAGVNFVLEQFPTVEAFYFFDADNRLSSYSISNAYKALKNSPKNIGWIYPDIDMFGTDYNLSTDGKFSILKILFQNYCEAGSMIRREVFETGIRYDEQMVLGYEDWEFWYQAIEKGFIGKHIDYFGFKYRKRPESMLADSTRDDMQIKSYMRRKHKKLFSVKNLLNLEQNEAPRYSVVFDTHESFDYLDPININKKHNIISFSDNYFSTLFNPYLNHTSPIKVFSTKTAWNVLKKYKLLNWLHWYVDDLFEKFNSFVMVKIQPSNDQNISFNINHNIKSFQKIKSSDLIFTKRDLLNNIVKDVSDSWFKTIFSENIQPNISLIEIFIPERYKSSEVLIYDFDNIVTNLRLKFKKYLHHYQFLKTTWKKEDLLPLNDLNKVPKNLTELSSLYPLINKKINIGFMLPLSSFGGVEKVTHNLAKELKKVGYGVHLFIINDNKYTLFTSYRDVYDTINFLGDKEVGIWYKDKSYFGVGTTTWHNMWENQKRALGMLSAMDVVVNQHSVDMLAITGMIKRLGIKTVDYLHLLDKTIFDEDTGHPLLGIAYEHGFEKFVVISEKLKNLLHGMGVPKEKIELVPNAPSYDINEKKLKLLQERKLKRKNKKLNVLYIGRLDRQKGLERLEKIYNLTNNDKIEWKIIGKSILEGNENCKICKIAKPPVFDDNKLTSLYEWADCIVMPSHNEGVPLVMLEAMRLGTIPICSDVGAISEIIENAKNGYVIENDTRKIILNFSSILTYLSENIQIRKEIQQNAIETINKYSWEQSAKIFEEKVIKG